MINTLVWNAHRVGNHSTVNRLKRLVRLHFLSFLVLLEPFIADDRLVALQNKLHFSALHLSANKKIFLFWRHGLFTTVFHQTNQFFHVQVQHPQVTQFFQFTVVYAKHTRLQ